MVQLPRKIIVNTAIGLGALCLFPMALAEDPYLARNLAATCANCHGTNGNAVKGAIESLAGMDKAKFLETMKNFQDGTKPATVMHQISKGYTDKQLNLMADFFANQK